MIVAYSKHLPDNSFMEQRICSLTSKHRQGRAVSYDSVEIIVVDMEWLIRGFFHSDPRRDKNLRPSIRKVALEVAAP